MVEKMAEEEKAGETSDDDDEPEEGGSERETNLLKLGRRLEKWLVGAVNSQRGNGE